MVSITKCCHTFHSQAKNFCYPYIDGDRVAHAWEAVVIPVLKPGTDRWQATDYRPTNLTSCLCKRVEPTVGRRLFWVQESRNLLTGAQCGVRRHRSVLDHLMNLDCHMQNAFLPCQRLVAVFFDLQKAYNTTWRYGILRILHRWDLRGRCQPPVSVGLGEWCFIPPFSFFPGLIFSRPAWECFLCAMSLRKWSTTRIGFKYDPVCNCHQQFGGRSWAVTTSLCVDEVAIHYSSRSIVSIERRLQGAVNRLSR
jgi:hypothetical protein